MTILDALYEVDSDSRMLSLLFSWAKVHGDYLIADKFFKYYKQKAKYSGECPWIAALSAYMVHLKNHKFKKGLIKQKNEVWVAARKSESSRKMHGTIDYLEDLNIIIPTNFLRVRESDVITKDRLIKRNLQYRLRFQYGVNWRSEIIYSIQKGLHNPNKISKELGISYSNVWLVFNDYMKFQNYMSSAHK
jgi:hypothetical protein